MLKFKVGELLTRDTGSLERYEIDTSYNFPDNDPKLLANLKGEVILIKTTQGINAEISNFKTEVELNCSRCLEKYPQTIKIPSMEEHFYTSKPKGIKPTEEISFIDMKHHEIDLSELIRQEIISSYDMIPVCKKDCKGLCSKCGQNLNKKTCKCDKSGPTNKPFANLKNLLK